MKVVGLSTYPLPCSSTDVIPNAHMWEFTMWGLTNLINFLKMSKFHEEADCGCSWRKYLLPRTWIVYSLMQNSIWEMAWLISAWNMSVPLFLFRFCSMENMVHIGLPMTRIGFVCMTSWMSLLRCLCSLRSHGFPCSSQHLMSMECPGVSPCLSANCTTLGGEYTSVTRFRCTAQTYALSCCS